MDAKPRAFLSLLGLMLVWPSVLSDNGARSHTAGSVSAYNEPGQQRPRVERSAVQSCGSDYDHFCFNNGKCMLLVDTSEKHHCKCERGYSGHRCDGLDLVFQPMKEEQLILVAVCVVLLLIGLSGALYFFYQWYRRNRCPRPQKRRGYMGVESA